MNDAHMPDTSSDGLKRSEYDSGDNPVVPSRPSHDAVPLSGVEDASGRVNDAHNIGCELEDEDSDVVVTPYLWKLSVVAGLGGLLL
jgi:hypothetical protein